jgi:CheY-like chemotaxis protein
MYPNGQQLLVVIAEPSRRERVVGILGVEGFAVTAAAEGLSALRAAGRQRFAMMITDIRLPGSLDGRTTVRKARKRQPWLKALYIEDSGHRDAAHREAGNPDREDFIFAPLERHELIGCTFELLHRRPSAANGLACRARTELRAS